ncbi:MAG: hypothetical protein M3Q09_04945 [Gemmatimonadota bacterium]|nr:hypothetical protein [Gemmatimonadota bacterium]
MRAIALDDMVVLRATRKVQKLLDVAVDEAAVSDGVLGDWYVKRFVVDRRPLLMMMSAVSLFPIITPARDVRSLPARLGSIVSDRLKRIGLDEMLIQREVATMTSVAVGSTRNRSVMGSLVEFCKLTALTLPINGWDEASLPEVEEFLQRTPCRCGRPGDQVIFPADHTRQLLEANPVAG